VIISFLAQVPTTFFAWTGGRDGFLTRMNPSLLDIVIALVGPLALIFARRFPGPVVAIVSAAAAADLLVGDIGNSPPYVALAFAIISAFARGARIWAWISVAAAWVTTLTVGLLFGAGDEWAPGRVAATTFGILIVMGLGEGLRSRREHYEEYRRIVAQRKQSEVQAERVRIARELHDVLAHSLSQINVQAGVGLHLMDKQPDKAAEALASIKETSKTALDEVRSVLGVLRAENGDPNAPLVPEPDLARLEGLAASVTSQGVDVTLTMTVTDVPKAVQLAIYRIVQESLTNVVRHAHATAATVDIRAEKGRYLIEIADNGAGMTDPAGLGAGAAGGRGLLGMRERAELLGGTLETGAAPAGGLLVTARIPLKEEPK
jgi:signal transduction histidine kinase